MEQITTITFFRLNKASSKTWAFFMMQFGHAQLAQVDGQEFYKLMGSGRGLGFNPWPDWSIYTLLQIWENQEAAGRFFATSAFHKKYQGRASQWSTVFLRNVASHGTWDNFNPFKANISSKDEQLPRMILTRATIKKSKLRKFWNYVPTSQKPIESAKGLVYTKGVGEWPLTQMATLSVWESEQAMKDFAYGSEEHKKAIKMTRELNWYKEELFARFVPYKLEGDFAELNDLQRLLMP